MAVEDAVVALLRTVPTVQSVAAGRVYHLYPPQDAKLPCVLYRVVSRKNLNTLSGPTPRWWAKYSVECLGDAATDVRSLVHGIAALAGQQTLSLGGATLTWVLQEDEQDQYAPPQQADDRGVRYPLADITIWYTEP